MRERKALHKDWRTWVALAAMLAAIGAYVMTLDDSDTPAPPPQPAAQP